MNIIEYTLKLKTGIYILINLVNGKRYVGSSKDLYNRLHEHLHTLRQNQHHNQHLQNAWNKYGEDKFIYGILQYCSDKEQFEIEQYYLDCLHPEYNLSSQVIANLGISPSEETRQKISNTLKRRYRDKEINTYRQQHLWIKTYVYNIQTLKLVGKCDCRMDALKLIKGYKCANPEKTLYFDKYIISSIEFKTTKELLNFISKEFLVCNSKYGKYLISSENGNLTYHRNMVDCAKYINSHVGTLNKHRDATKDNPYILKDNPNISIYFSNEYIEIDCTAVPIEESLEELSGNIGESPGQENPEIIEETKGSSALYSVENEPLK